MFSRGCKKTTLGSNELTLNGIQIKRLFNPFHAAWSRSMPFEDINKLLSLWFSGFQGE